VIEHELAMRVVLQVTRYRPDQLAALPQGEVAWPPAPFRTQAAVFFQPLQERMTDERVAAVVQRIPVGGRQVGEAMKESYIGHG